MSNESTKSSPPLQTTCPITFLIIGGGIAGLATALALRRVGHDVRVLERTSREAARGSGGVRLPPNLTKILFHWGLKPALMQRAVITYTMLFSRFEAGDVIGEHVWDAGMLKETRGVWLMCTHDELYEIMHDAVQATGAQIQYSANVVSIDPSTREVVLDSGERFTGDVIVGADGEHGLSREIVVGRPIRGTPTGLALYDAVIGNDIVLDLLGRDLFKDHCIYTSFGDGRGVVAYPVREATALAMQFYGPDTNEGSYGDKPSVNLPDVTKELCPLYHPLLEKADKAVRVSIRDHKDLDEWVAEDGPLILVGEAAHPFPPGTIQATAMAVEDGAVLAKLFSHLSEERQIESFLYAFQELRQPRTRSVRAGEFGNVFVITLENGPEAQMRDDAMRAKAAKGMNVLDGDDGDVNRQWEEIVTIFGYDCEDEADDWWMQWGILRERALDRNSMNGGSLFDFSAMATAVQVTEIANE